MKRFLPLITTLFLLAVVTPGCKKEKSTDRFLRFTKLDFNTQLPHQINALFQVTDEQHKGVTGLLATDFVAYEDGSTVGSEGSQTIAPYGNIPYKIKTVLMLDISSSVSGQIQQIKDAAVSMINKMAQNQQIAIYTFDSQITLKQDFTGSASTLIAAIQSITVGSSSTNLYGAVVQGCSLLPQDYLSLDSIGVSNLILFTDGKENTGLVQKDAAISATQGKNVYVLGLKSADLDETTLKQIASEGKYYSASNASDLSNVFISIQDDIIKLSQSIYWLYYQSPKRGAFQHGFSLEATRNTNTGDDSRLTDFFSSAFFTN